MKYSYMYLVEINFLGFRYHGWQKQKNAKTLHHVVDKTLSFVFDDNDYKTLGIGRTDAMVSASKYYFQLLTISSVDQNRFIELFNSNAPQDISAKNITSVKLGFDLLNCPKIKEYHYYFSNDKSYHPFAAPFIVNVTEKLDIDIMQQGASLFKGGHYFQKYCTKPSEKTIFKRVVESCEIVENTELTASFFPERSYVLKVRGKGFLRYQIRLMMAVLFELGKSNLDLEFIEKSLSKDNDGKFLRNIAPASGLQLYDIDMNIN